jgi:catechol 2,3-dioxygenase-like lactoylglutathione lyase family enzyme
MRLQLALNVHDLEAAIAFYSKMFDTPPAKTKPGYANFAIENPPLKLVLFEVNSAHPEASNGTEFHHLNHLGVEVETAAEVLAAEARIAGTGIETTGVEDTQCCFAEKTETWVTSPEDARWEWYVKTGDTESVEHVPLGRTTTCCS